MTLEELSRITGKLLDAESKFKGSVQRYLDIVESLSNYAGYDESMMNSLKRAANSFGDMYVGLYNNIDNLHHNMWEYLYWVGNANDEARAALKAFSDKYPTLDSLKGLGKIEDGYKID